MNKSKGPVRVFTKMQAAEILHLNPTLVKNYYLRSRQGILKTYQTVYGHGCRGKADMVSDLDLVRISIVSTLDLTVCKRVIREIAVKITSDTSIAPNKMLSVCTAPGGQAFRCIRIFEKTKRDPYNVTEINIDFAPIHTEVEKKIKAYFKKLREQKVSITARERDVEVV